MQYIKIEYNNFNTEHQDISFEAIDDDYTYKEIDRLVDELLDEWIKTELYNNGGDDSNNDSNNNVGYYAQCEALWDLISEVEYTNGLALLTAELMYENNKI